MKLQPYTFPTVMDGIVIRWRDPDSACDFQISASRYGVQIAGGSPIMGPEELAEVRARLADAENTAAELRRGAVPTIAGKPVRFGTDWRRA